MSEPSIHVKVQDWLDKWAGATARQGAKNPEGKPSVDQVQAMLFPKDSIFWRRQYCSGWLKEGRLIYPSLCTLLCMAHLREHLGWFGDSLPYEKTIGLGPGLLEGEARKRGKFLTGKALRDAYPDFFRDPEGAQPFNVGDVLKIGSDGMEHYMVVRGYVDDRIWTTDNGQVEGVTTLHRYRRAVLNSRTLILADADKGPTTTRGRALTGVIPFEPA